MNDLDYSRRSPKTWALGPTCAHALSGGPGSSFRVSGFRVSRFRHSLSDMPSEVFGAKSFEGF